MLHIRMYMPAPDNGKAVNLRRTVTGGSFLNLAFSFQANRTPRTNNFNRF